MNNQLVRPIPSWEPEEVSTSTDRRTWGGGSRPTLGGSGSERVWREFGRRFDMGFEQGQGIEQTHDQHPSNCLLQRGDRPVESGAGICGISCLNIGTCIEKAPAPNIFGAWILVDPTSHV